MLGDVGIQKASSEIWICTVHSETKFECRPVGGLGWGRATPFWKIPQKVYFSPTITPARQGLGRGWHVTI